VGLAPTGKRRLLTAHTLTGHCATKDVSGWRRRLLVDLCATARVAEDGCAQQNPYELGPGRTYCASSPWVKNGDASGGLASDTPARRALRVAAIINAQTT
jgi:hypothetical protein